MVKCSRCGVEIADSNIKKTFVGKYSYDVNGNEYIITKGYQYRIIYHPNGAKRIADSTLVALTLMIAESRTEEKDVMVKVVINLINKNNYE